MDRTSVDCLIIDIAVLGDKRIYEKEKEKIHAYQNLKVELQRLWKARVKVIPVIV